MKAKRTKAAKLSPLFLDIKGEIACPKHTLFSQARMDILRSRKPTASRVPLE
jgi:hypothetical protein